MDRLVYWLQGERLRNFGDYLAEYLVDRLFLRTARHSCHVRVIGSALDDDYIPDLASIKRENGGYANLPDTDESISTLIAWGLGVRGPGGLSKEKRALIDVLAVRGPISASELRIGADVAMGDPGLLLPAIYQPLPRPKFTGKTLCVPHFLDHRTDEAILEASHCDLVLRPGIASSFMAIEQFIDTIAAARFVLCGSLHAAIMAVAYGVPFAFWRAETIDVPTKWADFAASVGIRCEFVSDLAGAIRFYQEQVEDNVRIPSLWPLIAASPYPLRPDALLKVLKHELGNRCDTELDQEMTHRVRVLEAQAQRFSSIAEESRRIVALLNDQIFALQQQVYNDQRSLGKLGTRIGELETQVGDLNAQLSGARSQLTDIMSSTTWRVMGLVRRLGSHVPPRARLQLRRCAKAVYWVLTPHRTAERLRFLRVRAARASAPPKASLVDSTSYVPDLRRILVADYRIPMEEISAGERATVGILRDLAEMGYEVTLLPANMAPSSKHEDELSRCGIEVVTWERGYDSSAAFLREHGHEFGAFYLIRVDVAESMLGVIREVAPLGRVIFHAPDLYFLREMRQAELNKSSETRAEAEKTRCRELAVMRHVNHVVVVSPAEVPYLKAELPELPVSVFPALYVPVEDAPSLFGAREHVFFLGGFAHPPNVDAVEWFSKEVWPLIRDRLPGVEFHIVGSEAPQSVLDLGSLRGVKVVGFLPDLAPVLTSMRVGVAPLLYGAGIKGKVGMTMGAGIPCVCTDIAAEGMHIQDAIHALIGNSPQDFADAVVRLYTNEELWNRLSLNGRGLIAQNFGNVANRASLMRVLDAAHALPIELLIDYCRNVAPRAVPVPDEHARVDISIIVPFLNPWHKTSACLSSILETSLGDGVCYELILIDDPGQVTINAAELFPGLKVVRVEHNAGFLHNCNSVAQQARGRHILLLKDDTIVLPGWLENLCRTLDDDPGVAIVGSKVLDPDGLIQEAGIALFSDGTTNCAGPGSSRHTPIFDVGREVDCVSDCSNLVRKTFWDEVGGFDERYKGVRCAAIDLAMAARTHGMRVLYQPASEIIHFGATIYVDNARPHKETSQADDDIRQLREKWKDTLEREHHLPVPWQLAASHAERTAPPDTTVRRRSGKLNVLYFSPFPSHPASHGNRATINQFATWMRNAGHKIHFVLLHSHEYTKDDLDDMRSAWDSLDVVPFSTPMVPKGQGIPFDDWYEEGLGERIRCLCDLHKIDIVFCSYIFQSKLLEFVPAYMLKVIDTHDKMGDRFDMMRKKGLPLEFFSCTPEEEGRYLQRADIVVARQAEEASYFDSVTGRNTAVVIPHIEPPRFVHKWFDRMMKVGLVASANRINLGLVRDFLKAIDRRLAGRGCPFVVHVAGQVAEMVRELAPTEAGMFRRPWVSMRGFVADIEAFFSELDLVVSPVTIGTGINVKTVQAMAFGMPLVTTECGSRGIETGEPMHTHKDLVSLVENVFDLHKNPSELQRLAGLSRERYMRFYTEGLKGFDRIFLHPILVSPSPVK